MVDLDEADSLDPSTVHLHLVLRAKIGNSINSLPTKQGRNKPNQTKKYHLDYGIMRGNDRSTGDGGSVSDLSYEEALETLNELRRNLLASGFRIVWREIVEDD